MKTIILRRKSLGNETCKGIVEFSNNDIKIIRNDKPIPNNTDLVIRWGCTSHVGGIDVINCAKAIHLVNDKRGFREVLSDTDLIPKTFFSDEEWFENSDKYKEVIIRPNTHSQGKNLLKISIDEYRENGNSLDDFLWEHEDYYISEYIPKVAEYRVFAAQGRVFAVANKIPENPNAVAWNIAQGGSFENVRWNDWNLKAVKVALEAFNRTGLDFGGVDIMVDENNKSYVLEINSAPCLTSDYRLKCMAKVFDYMIENGKEPIPLTTELGGYRKFIHPAICDNAILV